MDINKEILKHKHKLPVKISIKVNNLEEPYFINLLYKAVTAVVTVELIAKSIYCLIAEKEIISERIIIKRLIEKYFEPTGLFNFWADDDVLVALGLEDFMTRNLKRKVASSIDIINQNCRQQLTHNSLLQWQENTKSSQIVNNNEQLHLQVSCVAHNAQNDIFNYLKKISC